MKKEVTPPESLVGTLRLPADKSISHRSAMFAALHNGTSVISNFSEAADPHSTLDCLRKLGVSIKNREKNLIEVEGVGRDGLQEPEKALDCGNSGTTMRLLSGIIVGVELNAQLTGDQSLSSRTMKRIIEPLTAMGASIEAREDNYAPLKFYSHNGIQALDYPLPIASAQLKSCVLLAGLFGEQPTRVIETIPSRDHTERLLQLSTERDAGQTIITSSRQIKIPQQTYRIPNDFSAAAFWLVAGSVHPQASLELPGIGINPSRTGALDILQQMGANIKIGNQQMEGAEPVADLKVKSSSLDPVHISKEMVPNCIDELPILTVAMLFADGTSRISGAKELRHKETDRIKAIAEMLSRAGADFKEYPDGLEINGKPDFNPKAATFDSYHDHRIAMSAAILSLLSTGSCQISGAECTAISYPSFWIDVNSLTN